MTLKETAILVAIAVLASAFVLVSIDAVYPRPSYEDFCNNTYPMKPYPVESVNCTYVQTQEEIGCYNEGGVPEWDYDEDGCSYFKECDFCSRDLRDAEKDYSNNLMLILAPLGALLIIFGVFYKIEFIGSGFMYSGIFLMFYSTVNNFSYLDRFIRMVVVFLELCLILFIAYKKVVPRQENKKK